MTHYPAYIQKAGLKSCCFVFRGSGMPWHPNNNTTIHAILFIQCFCVLDVMNLPDSEKPKHFRVQRYCLFSDICKRKGLFYIFCGHFRQINTLKAAEAALNFSLVKKNVPPIWREILFLFRSQIKQRKRIFIFYSSSKITKNDPQKFATI